MSRVVDKADNGATQTGSYKVIYLWDGFLQPISDTGHITDPLAGRRPVGPRHPGSRGLLVTNLLSDLVRVHTAHGATTIRVYFDIR